MELISKGKAWKILGLALVVATLIAGIRLVLLGYSVSWTGFADFTNPDGEYVRGKTLWDWMDLFLIPIFLALSAFYLNRSERENDRKRAEERAILDREMATDRQQEAALQMYLDRMTELLLREKLRTTKNKEVRNVAKTRTFAILEGLDSRRKGLVVRFLKESGLIEKAVVVSLDGANLNGADLTGANLRGANLKGAILGEATLMIADLSGANLAKSYLYNANLVSADFSGANLSKALCFGASFSGSDLRRANLSGTGLYDADFTGAILIDCKVTDEQLASTKSLETAIMPDGTQHE